MRLLMIFAFLTCAAAAHAQVAYNYSVRNVTATVVPTLGGTKNAALGINNAGDIVGWSLNASGQQRAFLFRNGTLIDIPGASPSVASDINSRGDVVGTLDLSSLRPRAFLYSMGTLVLLADDDGRVREYPSGASAAAIADNGLIAGSLWRYSDYYGPVSFALSNATLWSSPYSFIKLAEHYDWSSWSTDVNSAGQVIGYDTDWDHHDRWLVQNGVMGRGAWIPEIPATNNVHYDFDEYSGDAAALNASGQVVGYMTRVEESSEASVRRRRAFFWGGLAYTDSREIGLLPSGTESVARDINDGVFIVGYANRPVIQLGNPPTSRLRNRAFLYHPTLGMYELPVPVYGDAFGYMANCQAEALSQLLPATTDSRQLRIIGSCDTGVGPRAVLWNVILQATRIEI